MSTNCENLDILESKTLKSPEEISDGYSSIEELFSKMSQITELQSEPNYPPQFRGENLPTYIFVGDIHGEEYDITKGMLKGLKNEIGCKFIIDEDSEGPEKEVDAIKILKEKFGINIVGFEGDSISSGTIYSVIGQLLLEVDGLNLIPLENLLLVNRGLICSIIPLIYLRRKIIENIDNIDLLKNVKPVQGNAGEYLLQILGNKDIKEKDIASLSNEELIELYSFVLGVAEYFYGVNDSETLDYIEKEVVLLVKKEEKINIFSIGSIDKIVSLSEKLDGKNNEMRNTYATDLMHSNIEKYKKEGVIKSINIPRVIIFGKDHIPGFIDSINKKYSGKANIYIAK